MWKKKIKIWGIQCHLGHLDDEWYICSMKDPMFCFQGKTEKEAIATAKRAFKFFWTKRLD